MKIIPAIDIIGGKCVRLTKGDYNTKKIYNENPLEVALEFQDNGVEYLHVVDLDGAKSKSIVNYKILEMLASKTNLKIDFGGGIKTEKDLKIAFECGAKQITGGSIAIKNRELFLSWLKKYGNDKIILGADVLEENISTDGWQENSGTNIFDFLDYYTSKDIKNVICTDISKDGMLEGSSFQLYRKILDKHPRINLIASGGVSNISDLEKLKEDGLHATIVGKAIYENKISMKELQKFILM